MAVVTRYFGTAAAGAGDGTTWADRAELLPSGNWSTVITGFDFSGSDSLKCLIGPGTHACSQALLVGLFANAPQIANALTLHGCDSSGNQLVPTNPDWTSAEPVDWDSNLPVVATITNIETLGLSAGLARAHHLKFTATNRTSGVVLNNCVVDWVVVENSGSGTSAGCAQNIWGTNVSLVMGSSTSFDAILTITVGRGTDNIRCRATGSPSSGNRRGIDNTGNGDSYLSRFLVTGCAGGGVVNSSTGTARHLQVLNCVLANNGGSGVLGAGVAAQSQLSTVTGCMLTGNGAYGVEASASFVSVRNCRLRDNTSGNLSIGNSPTDLNNYTTDSDDADDYVNAAAGDFRIRYGSPIWGKGFGVADAPPTAAEIAAAVWARGERTLTA